MNNSVCWDGVSHLYLFLVDCILSDRSTHGIGGYYTSIPSFSTVIFIFFLEVDNA